MNDSNKFLRVELSRGTSDVHADERADPLSAIFLFLERRQGFRPLPRSAPGASEPPLNLR
jgi:hypothetical protein